MKSAPIMTAVLATLTIAASVDVQAATIRTDPDADVRARLEMLERISASRGYRYFNRTSAMPDAVVVQAPAVSLALSASPKAAAPAAAAPAANCIPASIVAPAALPPAPPPVQQSTSYQQSMIAGSVGTAPARNMMARGSAPAASGSRGQVLQSLFDERSLRAYGVAAGKAPVITVTPVVSMTLAPAPAPAPAAVPVCVPADQSAAAKSSSQDGQGTGGNDNAGSNVGSGSNPGRAGSVGPGSNEDGGSNEGNGSAASNSGSAPGLDNPFLSDDLIPSFSSNPSGLPGIFGRQSVEDGEGGEGGGEGGANGEQGEVGPSSTEEIFIAAPSLVPEPGSLALLGLGLIGLGAARRRRPA